MRTVVILADNYLEGMEAAIALGLPRDSWIYPTTTDDLRGRVVGRVVYVDGWRGSPVQTVQVARAAALRMPLDTTPADEIEHEPTELGLRRETAAASAALKLQARREARTSIDPDAVILTPTNLRARWLSREFWRRRNG